MELAAAEEARAAAVRSMEQASTQHILQLEASRAEAIAALHDT